MSHSQSGELLWACITCLKMYQLCSETGALLFWVIPSVCMSVCISAVPVACVLWKVLRLCTPSVLFFFLHNMTIITFSLYTDGEKTPHIKTKILQYSVLCPLQLAFLSQERISFGNLPLFCRGRRMVFLTNKSKNRPVTFEWHVTCPTDSQVNLVFVVFKYLCKMLINSVLLCSVKQHSGVVVSVSGLWS